MKKFVAALPIMLVAGSISAGATSLIGPITAFQATGANNGCVFGQINTGTPTAPVYETWTISSQATGFSENFNLALIMALQGQVGNNPVEAIEGGEPGTLACTGQVPPGSTTAAVYVTKIRIGTWH